MRQLGRSMDLGFIYSHQCNITCRHCGILSSPHNKNRMVHGDAERYIREAAALRPLIGTIAFTGGEPFLFQSEHLELIKLSSSLGLATRVVTNGFWAHDVEKATSTLSRFREAGLREINFSADVWHLEFLDPSLLRNALEAARRLNYWRLVSYAMPDDSPPVAEFCRLYDIPEEEVVLYERNQFGRILADPRLREEYRERIFLIAGHVIGLGRAADHPSDLTFRAVEEYSRNACHEVNNKPVIYPNGDVYACCCAGGRVEPFRVGNLHDSTLSNLVYRMHGRIQFKFINCFGPREMYETAVRERPDIPRAEEYSSICEMCVKANEAITPLEMDQILTSRFAELVISWLTSKDSA
ncbi:MAG: radical SAM protein [Isosphaeraceae bacterium]